MLRLSASLSLVVLAACHVQTAPHSPGYYGPPPGEEGYEEGDPDAYGEHGEYDEQGGYPEEGGHDEPGAYEEAGSYAEGPGAALRDAPPVVCSGRQRVDLAGVRIATGGAAITASGQCVVVVSDSEILGGHAGIVASGRAQVFVARSLVRGRNAISVSGQAMLQTESTTYHGRIARSGMAHVEDAGGNRW